MARLIHKSAVAFFTELNVTSFQLFARIEAKIAWSVSESVARRGSSLRMNLPLKPLHQPADNPAGLPTRKPPTPPPANSLRQIPGGEDPGPEALELRVRGTPCRVRLRD